MTLPCIQLCIWVCVLCVWEREMGWERERKNKEISWKKIIGSRVFPVINKHLMFLFQLYAHCWKKEEQWILRNKAVWYIVDPAGKKIIASGNNHNEEADTNNYEAQSQIPSHVSRSYRITVKESKYPPGGFALFPLFASSRASDRSWFTAIWFGAMRARKKRPSTTVLDLSLGESHALSDSLPVWPFHFCSAPTASTQQRSLSHPPPPATKPHSINHTSVYLKILPCLFSWFFSFILYLYYFLLYLYPNTHWLQCRNKHNCTVMYTDLPVCYTLNNEATGTLSPRFYTKILGGYLNRYLRGF